MERGLVYRVIGMDPMGIPRAYGEGPTFDIAETRCMAEACDCVQRQRDLGPLDLWIFEWKGAR
jgi:hypothetical protein